MSALVQVSTWVTANVATPLIGRICILFVRTWHYQVPANKHRFFLCFSFLLISFMFPPSIFTQVYIITYSMLTDCFKMTPTGTVCLAMAALYTLPKPGLHSVHRSRRNMAVILQFPFIMNGNKIQGWREIEGNIQMILAPGYVCGDGELIASHCGSVALWQRQKVQLFIAP